MGETDAQRAGPLETGVVAHGLDEALVEEFGGVNAHFLEAVVQGGDFDDDGHIPARAYGDAQDGQLAAQHVARRVACQFLP